MILLIEKRINTQGPARSESLFVFIYHMTWSNLLQFPGYRKEGKQ